MATIFEIALEAASPWTTGQRQAVSAAVAEASRTHQPHEIYSNWDFDDWDNALSKSCIGYVGYATEGHEDAEMFCFDDEEAADKFLSVMQFHAGHLFDIGKIIHKDAVDNAPMAAAPFLYNEDGSINWRDMWNSFCNLSLDGGPAHRGPDDQIKFDPDSVPNELWHENAREIIRGIEETTSLQAVQSYTSQAVIYLMARTAEQAMWLEEAINAEGVAARREGVACIALPCCGSFGLSDIKSVITAVAKTVHYWDEHGALPVPPNHIARILKPVQSVRDRYRK